MASIFDGLDLSNVTNDASGRNPFAFMAQGAQPAPEAPPPPPQAPTFAGGAGLGSPALDIGDPNDTDSPVTPVAQQGFLQRLTAPSPDGITFNDKLMALGSILKGDSGGAQKYLQTQRENVTKSNEADQKVKDADAKQKAAAMGSLILARNTDANGNVNMQGYLQDLAISRQAPDDKILATIYGHNVPHNVPVNGPRGGFTLVNENAGPGQDPVTFTQQPGPAEAPFGYGADGLPTANYLKGVQEKAAAERAGKPLAGRAGPAAAKTGYSVGHHPFQG